MSRRPSPPFEDRADLLGMLRREFAGREECRLRHHRQHVLGPGRDPVFLGIDGEKRLAQRRDVDRALGEQRQALRVASGRDPRERPAIDVPRAQHHQQQLLGNRFGAGIGDSLAGEILEL